MKRKCLNWMLKSGVAFGLLCLLLHLVYPLKVDIEYSKVIYDREGVLLDAYLTSDHKWRMKTELDELSPTLVKAMIAKEDKYFYYHPGVNPLAILRALARNLSTGKRTSGASTITMQVARMLEPKERSYFNKLKEIGRAFQLEMAYSKEEILQLYFNLVPYGGNIEGVKAAGVLYFQKPLEQISVAEACVLSIIPNRPNSLRPGANQEKLLNERNRWLKVYADEGQFTEVEIEDALSEPLEMKRHESPKRAPHWCRRMKEAFPEMDNVRSSLSYSKQVMAEGIVKNHSNSLKAINVNNATAIVIDNRTNEVVAYVGSADYYDETDSGQVDGIQALRAPGSTLKPLIYAMAFDKGKLTPKQKVSDVPVNFSGYSPVNYDGEYNGPVSVEDALSMSLNIPAVMTLQSIGLGNFVDKLDDAGFEWIGQNRDKFGLSLALGACGVRLEDLARLYASFAQDGRERPLVFLSGRESEDAQQLVSPAAAFMLGDILSLANRPDLPNNFSSSTSLNRIAWKTGTSYGRHDAWAVGYNKNYTIATWVGNFSGEGVPELNGAGMASPLLFELFNQMDTSRSIRWVDKPDEHKLREVCTVTGLRANYFCDHTTWDAYIPGVSSNRKCQHLQYVWIDAERKHSYCGLCQHKHSCSKELLPNFAPEVISYYEAQEIPFEKVPAHNPACGHLKEIVKPEIVSLAEHTEYYLDNDDNSQLALKANVSNEVKEVHWYVDDKFIGSAIATENLFFTPEAGRLKISCADDRGGSSDVEIVVKYF